MANVNKDHLIVFVKNPVLGKVKTRLAKGIGEEKALEVYLQLLEITRQVTAQVECTRNVFYSSEIEDDDWSNTDFQKYLQQGVSLGERMKNAFAKVFEFGAEKVLIIGSDCPKISPKIINQAFEELDRKDVVIGPAKDGGYYLLGMKKPLSFLFENKEWSTDSVFEDTVLDIIENRLSYSRLETLSDVDNIYDLHLLD